MRLPLSIPSLEKPDDGYSSSGIADEKFTIKMSRKSSPKEIDLRLRIENPSFFDSKSFNCYAFFRPCYRVSEFSEKKTKHARPLKLKGKMKID